MTDLLSYSLWHTDDQPDATDADGQPLASGWFYQFPEDAEPVGPFTTSGRAEASAEAEIEWYEDALAEETY